VQRSSRYHKQILFHGIGESGQQRLRNASVLIAGCGALGCVLADSLTRAGVGHIRIVDRDFVEYSNLQRQILFDEQDAAEHLPKAVAAHNRLTRINSEILIEPVIANLDFTNIRQLTQNTQLILDGTDNFETRYLINDAALELQIPWIFTGVTGSGGQVLPIIPGQTPCLRCLIPNPPPPGSTETCDTAGVLGPAVYALASLQAALALKILATHPNQIQPTLNILDVWNGTHRQVDLAPLLSSTNCPACKHNERPWLHGNRHAASSILCGRNAVQITPPEPIALSLEELAQKLRNSGILNLNRFLLKLSLPPLHNTSENTEITVFPDGRAIIRGTSDPAVAHSLYSRYIGG
jgi:adenylyltransferase/sulfurtransferase